MDFLMGYIGQKLGFLKGVYASELGICQKLENTVHFPSGSVHGRMPPSSSLDGMPAGSSFTKVCPSGYSSALGENIISDLRRQRYEESARETERRVM